MRKLLIPLTFAAATLAAGSAFAATATGAIQSINLERPSVTLEDGTVYIFKSAQYTMQRLETFKPGDMVQITWDQVGTGAQSHDALTISPVN